MREIQILATGDSMFPTLEDGKLYDLELLENNTIFVGDIIVFYINDLIICHRVVEVVTSKNQTKFFVTKGDNCSQIDPYTITTDKVIGKIIIN